ncbi:hypothetical protein ABIB00_004032 [Bradyrhizobium sp. LB14.3]
MYADTEGYFGQASGIPTVGSTSFGVEISPTFRTRSSVFAARESGSHQSSNGMHS